MEIKLMQKKIRSLEEFRGWCFDKIFGNGYPVFAKMLE